MMLEVEDLCITYNTNGISFKAVEHVNFSLGSNESIGLIGESGSGKTTTVMSFLRLLDEKNTKIEGRVLYHGQDLIHMPIEEYNKYRWNEIAVVFQKSMNAFSPVHKISTLCEDIMRRKDKKMKASVIREHVMGLFQLLNLPESAYKKYPFELSGGMKQRILIVLSLLLEPKLVIWDEITSAIDILTKNKFLYELQELSKKLEFSKVIITHDLGVAEYLCDKLVVMYQGKVVEMGTTEEIINNAKHPYTKRLLMSREYRSQVENSIKNNVPQGEGLCNYIYKCDRCHEICMKQKPQKIQLSEQHQFLCHLGGKDVYE